MCNKSRFSWNKYFDWLINRLHANWLINQSEKVTVCKMEGNTRFKISIFSLYLSCSYCRPIRSGNARSVSIFSLYLPCSSRPRFALQNDFFVILTLSLIRRFIKWGIHDAFSYCLWVHLAFYRVWTNMTDNNNLHEPTWPITVISTNLCDRQQPPWINVTDNNLRNRQPPPCTFATDNHHHDLILSLFLVSLQARRQK